MPNRILKESICSSEEINALRGAEEAFFYRLLVQCDDFGRYDARPAVLRARCYPLRAVAQSKIATMLERLEEVGLLFIYEVEGRPHLQVTKWEQHQQKRAMHSKWPPPPDDSGARASASKREHLLASDSGSQSSAPEKRETRNETSRNEKRETNARLKGARPARAIQPTDTQTYLLQRLQESQESHDEWSKLTWGGVVKLNKQYGTPAVTAGLQRVWEEKPQLTSGAYPLLEAICLAVLREQEATA